MKIQRDEKRMAEMKRLRFQKYWTLEMIGKRYGITRQRVGQIIGKSGFVSRIMEARTK